MAGLPLSLLLACMAGWFGAAAPAQAQPLPPVFAIRQGELHGLIDREGRVIVPAEFEELKAGEPLILVRKAARTAFLDYSGQMVIQPQSELTQPFAQGLAPAALRDAQGKTRYGYVDAQRKPVIAAAYAQAEGFVDGLAVVGVEDAWGALRYGAIDRRGQWVLQPVHEKILPHAGGVLRVEGKGRVHRAYGRDGRDITPAGVDFVGVTSEGMVRIWSARKQGFMSAAGELVVAPRYDQAGDFRDGMAKVWVDGKYGFIDRQGRLAVAPRFDTAEDFSDGLALVKEGGLALYVDRQGQTVLRPEADRAYPFAEGLAVVRRGQGYGFIDRAGKTVIEPRFSFARPFKDGLAFVTEGRASGYIRPDGRYAWRAER
ncbi:MAG TPA: WG repeat-containing protein [Ramlibacter sp.]|nr:WG repeat-containing protein [Ramlibacter sp.]